MQALLLHMECVAGVNALRVLLNRKCLVGIMGTQDAGKSTLRNLLAGQTDNGKNSQHIIFIPQMMIHCCLPSLEEAP